MTKKEEKIEVRKYWNKTTQEMSVFIGNPVLDLEAINAMRDAKPFCPFCGRPGIGMRVGVPIEKGGLFCPHIGRLN